MNRILLGNVVSDAYFESPRALSDPLHERGDRLGWRMAWLARPGDVVVASSHASPEFLEALRIVLGFSPCTMVVERRGRQTLPEAILADTEAMEALRGLIGPGRCVVAPYAASADVYDLASSVGARVEGPDPSAVRSGLIRAANSKCCFRRLADELAVPVADGILCDALDGAVTDVPGGVVTDDLGDTVIVKERLSGGGLGNRVVAGDGVTPPSSGHPFVVERFESFRSWPSADFVAYADGRIEFRQLSLMRITDHAYDGVVIPAREEATELLEDLLAIGRRLGRWWRRRGFIGWYDVDAGVTRDGRLVLTELNARCTGGTPIDAVARRLVGDDYQERAAIVSREHLRVPRPLDAVLRESMDRSLVATPGRLTGIVPLWEAPQERALGYMAIGPTAGDAVAAEQRFLSLALEGG
jgi:Pre ATP-grasp domain